MSRDPTKLVSSSFESEKDNVSNTRPEKKEREVRKQVRNFSRRLPRSTTAFHLSHDCRAFTWQDSAAQRMNLRRKRDVRHTTKNIHEQVDSFALCVPFHGSLEWIHKDEMSCWIISIGARPILGSRADERNDRKYRWRLSIRERKYQFLIDLMRNCNSVACASACPFGNSFSLKIKILNVLIIYENMEFF